jgi:Zn-finger nucleic acid-binding protein
MKCPQCEQPLMERSLLDTPIAFCDACRGWWFEPVDADALLKHWRDFPDASRANPKKWREAVSSCPRCGVPLVGYYHPAYNTVVKVEKCRKCRGFWLDDGEVRRLSGYRDRSGKTRRPGAEETPAARYLKKTGWFAIIAAVAIILLTCLFIYLVKADVFK